MPKVDDESGQPMNDAPEGDSELRGGKKEGDPDLPAGSNPQGSDGPASKGH